MTTQGNPVREAVELRRRAESRLGERSAETDQARSDADTQRFLHELQVHHIELEMQNEELRQARDALETGMEKYSELFDFAPVGYLTLDRDGAIREANLTIASLLGVERSRLLQRKFAQQVAPADRPAFDAFRQKVSASRGREFIEVTLLPEGRSPVAVRIEAAMAASGAECRVTVTDLTERNRAEQDRLILSKLESTGILAAGIAHDFNNLLTVILLGLEQAQSLAPAGAQLAHLFDETKNTVLQARGLTQQLITFAGGGSPVRKRASLSAIIHESVRPAVSGSQVRCEISLAEDLWLTEIDEDQIGQVMRNLVLNAREAMPEGGVVSIRAENVVLKPSATPVLPPGEYVRVSVADRGGGIAPDVLPKIFDPYFSTKQRGTKKGMGLGLAICHGIMLKHGGAIEVQSEVGVGTTFRLCLPASQRMPGAETVVVPVVQPRCGRILLMDDELALRNVLGATLQRMGHEVETVADGRRAIEVFSHAHRRGQPFDVVILDLTVRGGLGGREAMMELRKIDPNVKAVVMTGYSNDPAVLEPGRYGFKGVLAKPFDGAKLKEQVSRLLAG